VQVAVRAGRVEGTDEGMLMSDTNTNPIHDDAEDPQGGAMPMPHGSDGATPPVDGALPMPHEGDDTPPVDGALPMPHGTDEPHRDA
jgi:hypothetical protein